MNMADEKKSTEKHLDDFLSAVRAGAENRGIEFAIIAWFPDPLSEVSTYATDWTAENFAANGAVRELLAEIRSAREADV
jgi:hypothetical protein